MFIRHATVRQSTFNSTTDCQYVYITGAQAKESNGCCIHSDVSDVYLFANLTPVPQWELQVQHISQLWNAIGNLIDHNEFYSMFYLNCDEFYSLFSYECAKRTLPYENCHMETAFEKANKERAMELIVLVVDRILKYYMAFT